MDKNYNSTRDKLILPEYGRNVVTMVNELLRVEEREERNKQARIIIDVMGNINPTLRDSHDHKHKLWDHLHILADFALDIDSPYEKPMRDVLIARPERIKYRKRYIAHKQYGNNVREAIQLLCENRDKEPTQEVTQIASNIAVFMRQKSFEYNNEYPSNEVIISDFNRFSRREVELNIDALDGSKVAVARANISQRAMQNVRGISQGAASSLARRPAKGQNKQQKNGKQQHALQKGK